MKENGAVDLKNNIGILPIKLQKKLDRRNSVILQDMEAIDWDDEDVNEEESIEIISDDLNDEKDKNTNRESGWGGRMNY